VQDKKERRLSAVSADGKNDKDNVKLGKEEEKDDN
jgi:hypothetical protein